MPYFLLLLPPIVSLSLFIHRKNYALSAVRVFLLYGIFALLVNVPTFIVLQVFSGGKDYVLASEYITISFALKYLLLSLPIALIAPALALCFSKPADFLVNSLHIRIHFEKTKKPINIFSFLSTMGLLILTFQIRYLIQSLGVRPLDAYFINLTRTLPADSGAYFNLSPMIKRFAAPLLAAAAIITIIFLLYYRYIRNRFSIAIFLTLPNRDVSDTPVVCDGSDTLVRDVSDTPVRDGSDTPVVRDGSDTLVRDGSDTLVRDGSDTLVRDGSDLLEQSGSYPSPHDRYVTIFENLTVTCKRFFCIVLAFVLIISIYMCCVVYFNTNSTYATPSWVIKTKGVIAHALGGYDKQTYLNTIDAMEYNYDNGHRVFEMDICLTSDDIPVGVHDWYYYGYQGIAPSYDEFVKNGIPGGYTPTSFEDAARFMSVHTDAYLITDKIQSFDTVAFSSIINICDSLDPSIKDRIIIQVYNQNGYYEVTTKYPQFNVLYTLYNSPDTDKEVIRFVEKTGIKVITMGHERVSARFVRDLKQRGAIVFAHTVNDANVLERLRNEGVYGVYTDFLRSDDVR